jgi:hypothetical protein
MVLSITHIPAIVYVKYRIKMADIIRKDQQYALICRFHPFYRPGRPLGRVEVQLYFVLDLDTRRGEGSASRPGRFLPPGNTRYPLYRRLGGPQGRSGQVRKISPPPGFDPRTVQPIAIRYTD